MEQKVDSLDVDADGNPIIRSIDADLAVVLGQASNAAYADFADKPNKPFDRNLSSGKLKFTYHDRFYGLDTAPWGTGYVEKFGLIYIDQSDPHTVIIAFRGTASILDAIKDLEALSTSKFVPHAPHTTLPKDVWVGDGFYSIYSQAGPKMPQSMQAALFTHLKQLQPKHIIITGHSLGCPLGSMFALDVALNTGLVHTPKITNINFASPRVGKQPWKDAYDQYVTGSTVTKNVTIRIVNSHDWVPTLPSHGFPSYFRHVGPEFPVSFHVDGFFINPADYVISWHSLNNYQTVIGNAVFANPQGWSGKFTDAPYPKWQMISKNPFLLRSTPKSDWLKAFTNKGKEH